MSIRKSLFQSLIANNTSDSTPSSPLRRSLGSNHPDTPTLHFQDNDDDAELQRRRSIQPVPPTTPGQNSDRRRSFGLGAVDQLTYPQITERVAQCIKLNAENKINKKNAFSLQMIDFMTYMIKKRDDDMSNLCIAGTSLDVSTKIYGYRVDGFHTDVLNMVSGMDKQEKNDGKRDKEHMDDNVGETNELNECLDTREIAKKKRKSKQKILVSAESLRGKIETTALMPTDEEDWQTTDMLHQAMLPFHANCGLYLHPFNDVILDTVDPNVEEEHVNNKIIKFPRIPDISNMELCPSYGNFKMMGWSVDDEESLSQSESQPQSAAASNIENAFQFDLDASLPVDNEPSNGSGFFNDMYDGTENIDACRRENRPTENLVDFREVVQTSNPNKNSEYSYLQNTFNVPWVGPSYWKLNFPARNLSHNRGVERCQQQPARRRKEIVLNFSNETVKDCMKSDALKVAKRDSTTLLAKTMKQIWNREKITLPQDVHYAPSRLFRYFLQPDVGSKLQQKDQMNATHIDGSVENYDYDNENDRTNYCPNIDNERQDGVNDFAADDGVLELGGLEEDVCTGAEAFTGHNLVEAPKMTSKVFIPYSQRAKKIDMRQLKKVIWKKLSSPTGDKENQDVAATPQANLPDKVNGTKHFSKIFLDLPNSLSKSNAESLSLPIAFMSLLHLANEKSLTIMENDDLTDLIITQNNATNEK